MNRKSIIISIAIVIALLLVAATVYAIKTKNEEDRKTNVATSNDSNLDTGSKEDKTKEAVQPNFYYIALEDDGKSGKKVGCGDSLVAVESGVDGSDKVRSVFEKLLENHDREIGQSGLYNPLYQSNLKFDSWTNESGDVTVQLSGEIKSGGVCDDARIIAQLNEVAKSSSGSESVKVLINGKPVEEVLSGSSAE